MHGDRKKIKKMKILYITACYLDNAGFEHSYKYMIDSCKRNNIDLHRYGTPGYPGWIEIKIKGQLEYLKNIEGDYTHVLYTDGRDAFFTKDSSAIEKEYKKLGSPKILLSASENPQWGYLEEGQEEYFNDCKYRYPHSGGYIGKLKYVIKTLEKLLKYSSDYGDDSHIWYKLWKDGVLRPDIDSDRRIFNVIQSEEFPDVVSPIMHLAGGYSHPVDGKLIKLKELYERTVF